jgi:hypothetical protein
MKKYFIDYQTGAGNQSIKGTLEEAIERAIKGARYTQESILIFEANNLEQPVAVLRWYGVKATINDDVTVDFGDYGYYSIEIY